MCIVLALMALLLALVAPAMSSAFTESLLRVDVRKISLLVKTAMVESQEDQVSGDLSAEGTTLTWHQVQPPPDTLTTAQTPPSPDLTVQLTSRNQLEFPDAKRPGHWVPLKQVSWRFQPGQLCPLDQLRLERGKAFIELTFDALTGDASESAFSIP